MAQFSVNASRIDPYKNFKFVVKFDGLNAVAGLSKCGGLKDTTEMIEWREAGNSSVVRKLTGRTNYQPLVLEAGLTHDTTFEDWANRTHSYTGAADSVAQMSLATFRREIRLEMLNEQGTPVLAWNLHEAWVVEYTACPDLDSNAHAVAISSIKIDHEGFERDLAVSEPLET